MLHDHPLCVHQRSRGEVLPRRAPQVPGELPKVRIPANEDAHPSGVIPPAPQRLMRRPHDGELRDDVHLGQLLLYRASDYRRRRRPAGSALRSVLQPRLSQNIQ
jgi:hypothetical protein